jgi:GntR family transcriptional regulator/MocR family aminotransferase
MASSSSAVSLLIRIDSRLREGLQQQIYRSIRRAILDGIVGPGTRLPSSRALAGDLGVSRTTTLLAVQQLQAEGYLTARRGSGTSVADELPDDLVPRDGAGPGPVRHPALSRRGTAVSPAWGGAPPDGPPRAFRIETPGVDLFRSVCGRGW